MYRHIEELLALGRKGDSEAKEELILQLKPLVLSSIRRYYNRGDLYDDLIQEGYEVILNAIGDYDPDKGVYFLGYVSALLRYHYLEKHREIQPYSLNSKVDGGGEILDLIEGKEDPVADILEIETRGELFRALDCLTHRQKEVLIYFYVYELNMHEIARRLGIAYRTVVNTKTRAIEKLRNRLVR
ncbi:MAG: sigma-70 family RNA polymerase sigma factor [Tissierellia bacterium]|nr:sigma-70 family RNA polymerase sigma factor [Tissierellia bacterium]